MWKYFQLFFALLLLSGYVHCLKPSFQGRFISRFASSVCRRYELRSLSMQAGSVPFRPKPTPGSPIVRYIYSNNNLALLSVCVPGLATKKAFAETCDRFNEVFPFDDFSSNETCNISPFFRLQDARVNKRSINGLKVGEKVAYQALYDLYGEMQVKNFCSHFLSEAIAVRLLLLFSQSISFYTVV